jgi:predicted nucleic acid-binding protein
VTLVLDASLTMASVLRDETTEAAQAIMLRVAVEGAHAPSLWRLEVANVLRNAVRRGRCDLGFVDEALRNLEAMSIVIDAETDAHAWNATLALSRAEDLTPYDAAYLELSIRLGATLASCDRELIAAARRRGLDVLTV